VWGLIGRIGEFGILWEGWGFDSRECREVGVECGVDAILVVILVDWSRVAIYSEIIDEPVEHAMSAWSSSNFLFDNLHFEHDQI
jgi:hypothetical protein